jgi:NAD(P)-dependent dehydrogenase (short-subunit alcohol dehydrogenase family)
MSRVWFVTGASRGLGRYVVEACLQAGERVFATARNPKSLSDLLERHPATLRTFEHDVRSAAAARGAVDAALEVFGRLDVVVNNAGYGSIHSIEHCEESEFLAEIETNLLGVVHVTRAALPALRRQRSGYIIQVSSVGGRMGAPGFGAYAASKWGVAGFSEVLAKEVGPLGIRVTVLEPGGMRTGFNAVALGGKSEDAADYRASIGPIRDMLASHSGHESGDPSKVAQVMLRLAAHPRPPLHLLLGSDSLNYVGPSEAERASEGRRWEPVTRAIDFDAAGPIPLFPD